MHTANAELWTTGSNDSCQLGHKGHETQLYPSRVQALDAHGVCQVACGQQHMLAVADGGALCAWGAADLGQLGMHTHMHACMLYQASLTHPATLLKPFSALLHACRHHCNNSRYAGACNMIQFASAWAQLLHFSLPAPTSLDLQEWMQTIHILVRARSTHQAVLSKTPNHILASGKCSTPDC